MSLLSVLFEWFFTSEASLSRSWTIPLALIRLICLCHKLFTFVSTLLFFFLVVFGQFSFWLEFLSLFAHLRFLFNLPIRFQIVFKIASALTSLLFFLFSFCFSLLWLLLRFFASFVTIKLISNILQIFVRFSLQFQFLLSAGVPLCLWSCLNFRFILDHILSPLSFQISFLHFVVLLQFFCKLV